MLGRSGTAAFEKGGSARVADQISAAFSTERLSGLDAKHLLNGRFKLLIENSIYDIGGKEFESRYFRSLPPSEDG